MAKRTSTRTALVASTSTTAQLLEQLNAQRVKDGQKPLKAWSGSKAALIERINVPAAQTAPKAATGGNVTLAAIANEIGIDPKIARAKARRTDAIIDARVGDSWEFPAKAKAKVITLLKTDNRRK